MQLPEIIILSTQRSGTHLLESFLKNHPDINGRGELFLRYKDTGVVEDNIVGKINVGIVMYNQLYLFEKLGGKLSNHKIIHLLRNPKDVALSRCQVRADKEYWGSAYLAHQFNSNDKALSLNYAERPRPDLSDLDSISDKINMQQKLHIQLLNEIPHLLLRYEDFVPDNSSIKTLNETVIKQLGNYIGVDEKPLSLRTNYIKTGARL